MKPEGNTSDPFPILHDDFRPVFFVGMNGSGTTMLVDSIGRHPGLYGYPGETKIIPGLVASIEKFGDLQIDKNFLNLWNHISQRLTRTGKAPVPSNWREFPRDLATVLDAVFRYFAAKEGKIRWCEKTPQHVQHIAALHGLFPKAKFVHIIRDGRDCVASINRRFYRVPEYSIYRWKHIVREGRKQGALLGDQYLEVRYEAVTEKPDDIMRQICEFLDLPFHEDVLLSRRPSTDTSGNLGEVKGGLVPNSGKWRKQFSDEQVVRMESIAGSFLQELGYAPGFQVGDSDPHRIKLAYWQCADYISEFTSIIRKDIKREGKIQWSKNFRRVGVALKQLRINRY